MITAAVLTGLILAAFAGGTWLAGRPELRRSSGSHTARALRQSRDDATVSWLRSMRAARRIPPQALAAARVTSLLAVIARHRAIPVQDVHLPAFDITGAGFAAASDLPAGVRAGLWQAAPMPGRPDVDNLDDTGALPKFIDWATNAPLSEVTSA